MGDPSVGTQINPEAIPKHTERIYILENKNINGKELMKREVNMVAKG